MRAKLSKTKRRRNLSEQSDNVDVFDAAFGIRIVFAPQAHKLVQVMRSLGMKRLMVMKPYAFIKNHSQKLSHQNRPISGQVVEVVHDDSDEQVQDQKGTDNKEGDEIRICEIRATTVRTSAIFGFVIANDFGIFLAIQHDFLPSFTSCRSEQHQQSLRKSLEVVVAMNVGTILHGNFAKDLKNE